MVQKGLMWLACRTSLAREITNVVLLGLQTTMARLCWMNEWSCKMPRSRSRRNSRPKNQNLAYFITQHICMAHFYCHIQKLKTRRNSLTCSLKIISSLKCNLPGAPAAPWPRSCKTSWQTQSWLGRHCFRSNKSEDKLRRPSKPGIPGAIGLRGC